jgi:hypothetical protein
MSMTRGTLMTLVDEMADAVGSPRWGITLKRQLMGEVHWREWRTLLSVNRMLRVGTRTPATDADGRFAKTGLNSGSGDATETWFRVLSLQLGQQFYQPAKYEDYPVSPTAVSLPYVWYEYGNDVQLIPAPVQSTPITVVVNHLPQRADLLVDDNSLVVFPDGYDLILAYETAASMMMKGAAETNLSAEMSMRAQQLRESMHQDVGRITTRPLRMGYADDQYDWGGV